MKRAASIPQPCQQSTRRVAGGWSQNPNRFFFSLFLIGCLIWGATPHALMAQEHSFRVIDQVALPPELGGGAGSTLYLELDGRWTIYPERPALKKETSSIQVRETEEGTSDTVSLQQRFTDRIRQLPVTGGKAVLGEVEYEFSLLDPHLPDAGMREFPEPDSMDRHTRELQAVLIELVKNRSRNIHRYQLEEQLLSVRFHERWRFDPATLVLYREVTGITPVIWQRRRTVEGEPVNEAGTGWPVYYKNVLSRVDLRNP